MNGNAFQWHVEIERTLGSCFRFFGNLRGQQWKGGSGKAEQPFILPRELKILPIMKGRSCYWQKGGKGRHADHNGSIVRTVECLNQNSSTHILDIPQQQLAHPVVYDCTAENVNHLAHLITNCQNLDYKLLRVEPELFCHISSKVPGTWIVH